MPPVPPVPGHGATPPTPDTTAQYERLVKGLYDAPPIPTHTAQGHTISPLPQETKGRRQGSSDDEGNRRAGPIRQEGEGWVFAPSTSHISRFKFGGGPDGTAQLTVVFKGPDNQGEVAQYSYFFDDHNEATQVYDEMRRSPHPYGNVLYPDVIQEGIPFSKG